MAFRHVRVTLGGHSRRTTVPVSPQILTPSFQPVPPFPQKFPHICLLISFSVYNVSFLPPLCFCIVLFWSSLHITTISAHFPQLILSWYPFIGPSVPSLLRWPISTASNFDFWPSSTVPVTLSYIRVGIHTLSFRVFCSYLHPYCWIIDFQTSAVSLPTFTLALQAVVSMQLSPRMLEILSSLQFLPTRRNSTVCYWLPV